MTESSALRLRGVTKRFGGLVAVHEVTLDVPAGSRRALLGPNGAGKTTLVNLISGAVPLTSGSISLFGADVSHESGRHRVSRGLARTYQQSKLFTGLCVEANIELALIGARGGVWRAVPGGRKARDRREHARQLGNDLGLGGEMDKIADSLSHGSKRQLELAMALAPDPQVLVLDEPAAGLSPVERERLAETLSNLDQDLTLLLIEHDMNIALAATDSVTVMADGKVVFEGSTDEVADSELVHEIYLGTAHV